MIPALFIFCFSLFLFSLVVGYRRRAHSAEARANRAEGALEVSQHNLSVMAEITRECVKDVGLNPKEIVPDEVLPPIVHHRHVSSAEALRNWRSPIEAFCPSCNVSVRHDPQAYPVPCPACQTLIDPVLDNPPELS